MQNNPKLMFTILHDISPYFLYTYLCIHYSVLHFLFLVVPLTQTFQCSHFKFLFAHFLTSVFSHVYFKSSTFSHFFFQSQLNCPKPQRIRTHLVCFLLTAQIYQIYTVQLEHYFYQLLLINEHNLSLCQNSQKNYYIVECRSPPCCVQFDRKRNSQLVGWLHRTSDFIT